MRRAAVLLLFATACPGPASTGGEGEGEGEASWRIEPIEGVVTGGPRWGHIPAASSAGTYFIGGTDIRLVNGQGDVMLDAWRVDVDSAAPVFVPLTVAAGPEPRYCGCAAVDEDRDELLVVGGRDQDNMVIHNVWVLSLSDGSWTPIAGDIPAGMIGCGVAFVPGAATAYLFGGGAESFASSQTWRYDAANRTFTELAITGPSARFDHAARLSGGGTHLWVVSGAETAVVGFSPEVWRFDFDTESWTHREVTGDEPPGRRTPWVALREDDTQLVMGFGTAGLSPESDLGDLWLLDLVEGAWQQLDVDGMIPPRAFSYHLRAPDDGVGLIYAGTDMNEPLADLFVLKGPEPNVRWR